MLKFEIRSIVVDEEILGEVHLELVYNISVDTVKMREIEMQEKIRLKSIEKKLSLKEYKKGRNARKKKNWRKQMQLKMKELEFAREKEPLFENWLTSNEITTHFDKLRQDNSY